MKNAIVLVRVSSKDQEDGYSLEAQLANLQNYAGRKDLEIIQVFRIIESSTKGHRPEFERMIDFIRQQPQRVALIVDCVDRLQRSFTHTPILDALMREDKLEIHFVREGNILDKDATSSQKLMWNMGVVMAQSYTDQLSDNVRRSFKQKLAQGEWNGMAPLGYLNAVDKETGRNTVILDKERAFLIKRLFTEYATGTISMNELQRRAKDWGLRSRKGYPVVLQTISNILKNPFYYGMMQVKGKLYPHSYPPIVDQSIWKACEAVYTGLNSKGDAVHATEQSFALAGLVKCAVSGRTVTCDLKKGKYVYLIARDPQRPEKKIWVKESVIMDQIAEIMRSITIPEAVLEPMVDYLRQSHEAEVAYHQQKTKSLTDEIAEISRKMDSLTDLLIDKSITKDVYTQKHTLFQNRRMELNYELEQHMKGDGDYKIALSTLLSLSSRIYDLFESSKSDEKRRLIGFVFSNLEIYGEELRFSLRKPFDLFVNLGECKEWLGRLDSNQRMAVPKTAALPLGDAPTP